MILYEPAFGQARFFIQSTWLQVHQEGNLSKHFDEISKKRDLRNQFLLTNVGKYITLYAYGCAQCVRERKPDAPPAHIMGLKECLQCVKVAF